MLKRHSSLSVFPGGLEERAAGKLTYAKGKLCLYCLVAILLVSSATRLDFPPHQIGELAALNVTEYTKFKNAKGAQIEPLMKDLFNALDHLSKETNTNAAVTLMIKQGLLWVGKKMSAEFDKIPWGGNLTVWLGTVIASAGGMAVIGPVVGAIVIVFAILWLLLKGYLSSPIHVYISLHSFPCEQSHQRSHSFQCPGYSDLCRVRLHHKWCTHLGPHLHSRMRSPFRR